MAFKIAVSVNITKDDKAFHKNDAVWDNLDYEDVVVIEKALIGALQTLNDVAEKRKDKK